MLNKNRIIQEISVLYELSLAVGNSLEARENCQQFLDVLTRRKGLSFASVWVKNSSSSLTNNEDATFRLLYGTPYSRMNEQVMKSNHSLFQVLGNENFIIVDQEPSFSLIIQEKNVAKGSYALFRLGNFGVLKLFRIDSAIPFSKLELSQLRNVVNKFAVSLEGCLAFEKLQVETKERQLAEQKLRTSNDRYFDLFENIYDVLLTVDDRGKITQSNRAGRQLLGIKEGDTEPLFLKELIHPEDAERSAQYLKQLEEDGYYSDYEGRIVTRDGDVKYVQVNSTAIYENGKFVGSRDMVRDITTRKQVEMALRKAKREAEQARLAEQQFLANMSHEIRTPMNAVIGMTHLLGETPLNTDQKEYLDSLQFSATHLLGLINNILDISKIEAGELVFESNVFDLKEQLQMLQQTFQLKLNKKGVDVIFEVDSSVPQKLIGDSLRLNQILSNLLGNSAKFTHEGHIGVKTELIEQEQSNTWLRFSVFDTGIGIEPSKLDFIFENFKQADLQVTRKYGGTGLGLSIVKQLVEIQGGRIEVKSKPNVGTTFLIYLPFTVASIAEEEDPCMGGDNNMEHKKEINGTSILVVEDNDMNQRLIKRILSKWDCQFEVANNGLEGVQQAQQKKYDVILMDIHMPEMDGVEATIEIRNLDTSKNQKTPIIALTAAALMDERKKVFEAGMNDFMVKPFAPEELKKTILKHLDECKEAKVEVTLPTQTEISSPKETNVMLDLSYLSEISGGDEEFMADMIETFIGEAPQNIEELSAFLLQKNYTQLAKTAHRIKPNLLIMGLPELEAFAKKLERGIKDEVLKTDQIEQFTNELVQGLQQKVPVLQKELDRIKAQL
jgi:PAS domain S-box-containing protein